MEKNLEERTKLTGLDPREMCWRSLRVGGWPVPSGR